MRERRPEPASQSGVEQKDADELSGAQLLLVAVPHAVLGGLTVHFLRELLGPQLHLHLPAARVELHMAQYDSFFAVFGRPSFGAARMRRPFSGDVIFALDGRPAVAATPVRSFSYADEGEEELQVAAAAALAAAL